jgi:hypothetical protein
MPAFLKIQNYPVSLIPLACFKSTTADGSPAWQVCSAFREMAEESS